MSDLRIKWILKTNSPSGGSRPDITPTDFLDLEQEFVLTSVNMQELQQLKQQKKTRPDKSYFADKLYKIVHAEPPEDSSVFTSSMNAPGQLLTDTFDLYSTRS